MSSTFYLTARHTIVYVRSLQEHSISFQKFRPTVATFLSTDQLGLLGYHLNTSFAHRQCILTMSPLPYYLFLQMDFVFLFRFVPFLVSGHGHKGVYISSLRKQADPLLAWLSDLSHLD